MQSHIQTILGLQNDILGWQKDHLTQNPLNAIQVLIRDGRRGDVADAYERVLEMHNALVVRVVEMERELQQQLDGAVDGAADGAVDVYAKVLLGFGNAMAGWMLGSERYRV